MWQRMLHICRVNCVGRGQLHWRWQRNDGNEYYKKRKWQKHTIRKVRRLINVKVDVNNTQFNKGLFLEQVSMDTQISGRKTHDGALQGRIVPNSIHPVGSLVPYCRSFCYETGLRSLNCPLHHFTRRAGCSCRSSCSSIQAMCCVCNLF